MCGEYFTAPAGWAGGMAERGAFVVLAGLPVRACTICARKPWRRADVEGLAALARDASYVRYVGDRMHNVVGADLCFVCQTRLGALPPVVWDAFEGEKLPFDP